MLSADRKMEIISLAYEPVETGTPYEKHHYALRDLLKEHTDMVCALLDVLHSCTCATTPITALREIGKIVGVEVKAEED